MTRKKKTSKKSPSSNGCITYMTRKKKTSKKKSPSYNDCITVRQAVEYTGLSKSAIHYHVKKGAFPNAIRIGIGRTSICLIPFSEIKDWSPNPQGRPKQ